MKRRLTSGLVGAAVVSAVGQAAVAAVPTYTANILYPIAGTLPSFFSPGTITLPQKIASGVVPSQYYNASTGGNYAQVQSGNGTATPLQLPTNLGFVYSSAAYGTNGSQQVGMVSAANGAHAVLWNGPGSTPVDLDPSAAVGPPGNSYESLAIGTSGTQQVGIYQAANDRAVLWNGTAASAVSLNPTNFYNSYALATDGTHQVGYGTTAAGSVIALYWSGTAGSAQSLNPVSGLYDHSYAFGIGGGEQVGYGQLVSNAYQHALVWTGSASSVVDLNPAGFGQSYGYGTNGTLIVGQGLNMTQTSFTYSALLWTGRSAASAVNLAAVLPSTYTSSTAYTVDPAGDVFGIATTASGAAYAVEWSPVGVPEPVATGAVVSTLALAAGRRRRTPRGDGF